MQYLDRATEKYLDELEQARRTDRQEQGVRRQAEQEGVSVEFLKDMLELQRIDFKQFHVMKVRGRRISFQQSHDCGGTGGGGAAGRGIQEFTPRSRARMLDYGQCISFATLPAVWYEMTLTYGKEWPKDGKEVKRDFNTLIKRFRRKCGKKWGAIWKLEFQKRGAPHFHLMIGFPEKKELGTYRTKSKAGNYRGYDRGEKKAIKQVYGLRAWLQENWTDIIDGGIKEHNAGTDFEEVRSVTGMPHYLYKYVAKENENGQENIKFYNIGRFWGVLNRPFFEVEKETAYKIDLYNAQGFRKDCQRLLKRSGYEKQIYTGKKKHYFEKFYLPIEDAKKIKNITRDLLTDIEIGNSFSAKILTKDIQKSIVYRKGEYIATE